MKNSGVYFEESNVVGDNENLRAVWIVRHVFAFLAAWGMMRAFLTAFNIEVLQGYGTIYIWCVCLAGSVIFGIMPESMRKRAAMVIAVSALIVCIAAAAFLKFSFLGLLNVLPLGLHYDNTLNPQLFLVFAFTFMTVFITFCVYEGLMKTAVAAMLLPLSATVIMDRMPDSFAWVLLMMAGFGILLLADGPSRNSGTGNGRRTAVIYPVMAVSVIFVMYILLVLMIPEKGYEGSAVNRAFWSYVDSFNKKTSQKINTYDSVAYGGMSGGELGKSSRLAYRNKKMLTFTSGAEGSIYLRAFTGSSYENNSWTTLPDELYIGYEDIFDINMQQKIDIYNQTAHLFTILDNDAELAGRLYETQEKYINQVIKRSFKVEYDSDAERGYWYMPYGSQYFVGKKSEKDGYPKDCLRGRIEAVQYICMELDYQAFKLLADTYEGSNADMTEYTAWEQRYRQFVHTAYTQMTDEMRMALADARVNIPEAGRLDTQDDILEYVQQVRNYFADNYMYNLEPGALEDGQDFVRVFLAGDAGGYCSHFATAGTQILRAAGIPARYVEGYAVNVKADDVIGANDVEEIRQSGKDYIYEHYTQRTVEVSDREAHAWVEIYMDGYGWIPVEFTPSYSNVEVKADTEGNKIVSESEYSQIEQQNQTNDEQPKEPGRFDANRKYDTISEYMENNLTKRVDFAIVIPIMARHMLKFILILLRCMAAAAVIALALYIPEKIRRNRRNELFRIHAGQSAKQDSKQVQELFAYIIRLGRFLKVQYTDSMSCAQFAGKLKEREEYFEASGIDDMVYAIEKISYGHGNIGRDEMKRVVDAAVYIRSNAYLRLGRWRRLIYKFIWQLR